MKPYSYLLLVFSLYFSTSSFGQSGDMPLNEDQRHFLLRALTLGDGFPDLHLSQQAYNRKYVVKSLSDLKSDDIGNQLTNADYVEANQLLCDNGDFMLANAEKNCTAEKALLNTFYTQKSNFVYYKDKDYSFVLNPILAAGMQYESNGNTGRGLSNFSAGLSARASLGKRVHLQASAWHTWDKQYAYMDQYIQRVGAMPQVADYTLSNGMYQYWQFRGAINVEAIPDCIDISLGYDQHFIGNGIRSLTQSDFSAPTAYARIRTKIWKFQYQNLYQLLTPQTSYLEGVQQSAGYKFMTSHHLSLNLTNWLNIGLFESVTFSRNSGYEIGYLNPIIFYRAVERGLGSPDKVTLGLDVSAIMLKTVRWYAQVILNEFSLKQIFAGNGYWANKYGIQLGATYYNAFTLPNLDIQGEFNYVRPYTYQHFTSENVTGAISNYTHNNLALAHPLGAGFREIIGKVNYTPIPKLHVMASMSYYTTGVDTGSSNLGSNILRDYTTRSASYGITAINGPKANCVMLHLNLQYEVMPKLFVEMGALYRNFMPEAITQLTNQKMTSVYAGFRLNLARAQRTYF